MRVATRTDVAVARRGLAAALRAEIFGLASVLMLANYGRSTRLGKSTGTKITSAEQKTPYLDFRLNSAGAIA